MDVRRVRRPGRLDVFRVLLGAALALTLSAPLSASAQNRLFEHWDTVFDQYLPMFQRAHRGEGGIRADQLAWLYGRLIVYDAWRRDEWPDGLQLDDVAPEIHEYRRSQGFDPAPFADHDYNKSITYERLGDFARARERLEAALVEYGEDVPHRPLFKFYLATYERGCGEWDRSLERLLELEEELAGVPDGWPATNVRFLIELERCSTYLDLGLHEHAIDAVERARSIAETIDDPELVADLFIVEMSLANALDAFDRLSDVFVEISATPAAEAPDSPHLAKALLRLGIGQMEYQRLNAGAPREARETLSAARETGALDHHDAVLASLAFVDLDITDGDYDAARTGLEEIAQVIRSGDRGCGPDAPTRLEIDRVTLEAELALAVDAGPEELQALLAHVREAWDSMLARWAAVTSTDSGLAILHTRNRLRLSEGVVRLVNTVEGPESALRELIRAQSLGSLARALGADEPHTEPVESLAPKGGGLLIYLPGSLGSLVFAVDARGTHVFDLPEITRFDPVRRAFLRTVRAVVAGAPSDVENDLEEQRAVLSSIVLPAAVANHIRSWRHVAIVGVDTLGYVPFEYLTSPDGTALGDRHAVSYVPSVPVGHHLYRLAVRRGLASEPCASLVAAPDAPAIHVGGSAPLDFTDREERLLTAGSSGTTWRTLRGEHATLGAVAATTFATDLLLHVVAHGASTGRADRPRGLRLFGRDGASALLRPHATEALSAPPLVQLTACGAWSGPLRRGDDGRHHLAGALFLAGAETVVLPFTDIDYRAGLALAARFNEGVLERGLSPAEAMFQARRDADVEGHPVQRYLVHVVGAADATLTPAAATDERSFRGLWVLAGLAGLAIALLWTRRRAH